MTDSEPKILHVDMDAFFASVEIRDDPTLAGLPVCVGGSAEGRGVIAAASYAAREYGLHSALPTARALELCPELVLLPPNFEKYTAVSRLVMSIFRRYTPLVESLSLDEAFLDITGCERLHGGAVEIGHAIRRDILRETGLVASIGIAPTKFVAKLASGLDKPDGFRVIRADQVREVLDPLPVSKIFGIGQRTAKRLEQLGVRTVGDLARQDRDHVQREFGTAGSWIHDLAHGIDSRRVTPRREEKSHGMERTFPEDIEDRDELRRLLMEFSDEVAYALRSRGLRGRTITLKARYKSFRTVTRTKTIDYPTNLGRRIYATARELLERVPPGALRLLGVQVSGLGDVRAPTQGTLFDEVDSPRVPVSSAAAAAEAREERFDRTVEGLDHLRRKYGPGTVLPASQLGKTRTRGGDGREGRVASKMDDGEA